MWDMGYIGVRNEAERLDGLGLPSFQLIWLVSNKISHMSYFLVHIGFHIIAVMLSNSKAEEIVVKRLLRNIDQFCSIY